MRAPLPARLVVVVLAGSCAGCGRSEAPPPAEPRAAPRSRDLRGATPEQTVELVKQALERRRYRDVLLHVAKDDRARFVLGRLERLEVIAEGLGPEQAARKAALVEGTLRLRDQLGLERDAVDAHERLLTSADLASVLDVLGTLGATAGVDDMGGFADLAATLRDVRIEGDVATATSGDPASPVRWTFKRVNGAWAYAEPGPR
jgi:hypothetical protein